MSAAVRGWDLSGVRELGAQAPQRAAVVGDRRARLRQHRHQRLEPGLGATVAALQGRRRGPDFLGACLDDGGHDVVFGLEVVVHVAQRHLGCLGDVRKGGGRYALAVEQVACGGDQSLPLARRLRRGRSNGIGQVSHLTHRLQICHQPGSARWYARMLKVHNNSRFCCVFKAVLMFCTLAFAKY